ncbi:MAG: Zn-dependent alcohol dehydrogenase [Deltaproteobacteria bacterium]|nr:MAG: Zn-dependent alcohol dehydrogenase [Deltaproteobacteria bacterium]
MGTKAKAVICREHNKPVVVEEIDVAAPQRDEVLVKISACGVCHSDHSAVTGTLPLTPPLVLGHEGAGTVVELGEGVTEVAVGDSIVASWIPMCGTCRYCIAGKPWLCDISMTRGTSMPDGTSRLTDAKGNALNHFASTSVMAEYAVLHKKACIRIDPEIPSDRAALIGCGVMTGVGAALNTARVEPGSSVAVVGTGGIGLNVIQGAALAGAESIIAVDTADNKLEFARTFGATHTVNPKRDGDPVAKVMSLVPGGVDHAFECIGLAATITQVYNMICKGGKAIVVGVAPMTDMVTLPALLMPFQEKVLTGSMYGSARPAYDFPRLLSLYKAGKLKLDELVTQTYSIDDAPQAFEDLTQGANARGVIVF